MARWAALPETFLSPRSDFHDRLPRLFLMQCWLKAWRSHASSIDFYPGPLRTDCVQRFLQILWTLMLCTVLDNFYTGNHDGENVSEFADSDSFFFSDEWTLSWFLRKSSSLSCSFNTLSCHWPVANEPDLGQKVFSITAFCWPHPKGFWDVLLSSDAIKVT